MKKGRSIYNLQFKCDANSINQLMQSYLSANEFSLVEKNGEKYFRSGSDVVGYRGLIYNIQNQTITIIAWLDGALGNFSLEQKMFNIYASNYKSSLGDLFQKIENLNGGNIMNNNTNQNQVNYNAQTGQPINQGSQQNINQNYNQRNMQQNSFAQSFQNENLKSKEKVCEIGFWLSLFGLLVSFTGVAMGVFVYIIDFCFAAEGLKTKKEERLLLQLYCQ